MAIWKKAISTALSAALLASLLITAAAPAALASISSTSAGNVAQGTTSAGEATYLFTENSVNALTAAGSMTVTITTAGVTWAGTPVVVAPDSLGASVSLLGEVMTISIADQDPANVETIAISGLKVKASTTAAPGAVAVTLAGAIAPAFIGTTATATGTLIAITSSTDVSVNTTSACGFGVTGTPAANTTATFGSQTGVTVATVGGSAPGIQGLTLSTPLTGSHPVGETVTQTVAACGGALASPATVVEALAYTSEGNPTVFPGESNADAADLDLLEKSAGFLAKGTVITYTIDTAGVAFSGNIMDSDVEAGDIVVGDPVLAANRKSVTITVTAVSTVASSIQLDDIRYDVDSTVKPGTFVSVTVTLSSGKIVKPASVTNAVVFRGITASAPTPTVYIGENNQATGLVTLVEGDPGFFQSGTGSNNVLEVCPTGVDYAFTFAPTATVTAGNLRLREGDVASPDNVVVGTRAGSCYYWTVWTASTTASTIVISNGAGAGPFINVSTKQAPGIVAIEIYSGDDTTSFDYLIAKVGFATAAYRNQVAVTALSQPTIPAGAVTKAGAIQVAETANGQLKAGEDICFEIMPRGSTSGTSQTKYDTLISALFTAQLPVVTASGGLVIGPVMVSKYGCADNEEVSYFGTQARSFSFEVLQQSIAGTGKLVVDNINLITLADAFNGPVLFNVFGYGDSPTNVEFQAQVSNAKIGVKPAIVINSDSALGLMPNQGAWSTSTKVAANNKYITWRFQGGAALAGKTVQIQVATKNSAGGWGPFVVLTSRLADSSGTAYFQWRDTNQWRSVRAYYPGDLNVAESWSPARQGRWK